MDNDKSDTPSPLAILVTSASDATLLVAIRGEVDLATASSLQTHLIDALDRQPSRHVVIDAAALPLLDAAGIAALVAFYQHAAARHTDVRLINVRPPVSRVLHIVELVAFFRVNTEDSGD